MREIIITVGYPGAGKSTHVAGFSPLIYVRLNRDTIGGSLEELTTKLESILKNTSNSCILDNTYPTKDSRQAIISLGKKYNVPVKCHWLQASIEDAQYHSCRRMWKICDKILSPEEIKQSKNPNIFPPAVQFSYKKRFEEPTTSEGFSEVIAVPYTFRSQKYPNTGIIFDYDGTLRICKSGAKYPVEAGDIEILPNRKEVLLELKQAGIILCGASNQSIVSKGKISQSEMEELFKHTNNLLGIDIDVLFCPHSPAPITCYCRKPMPGIGVHFIEKYKLNNERSWMVGDMTSDKTFAKRSHLNYMDAEDFFSGGYKAIL